MTLEEKARRFATEAHADQLYNNGPYAVHLAAVAEVLRDRACPEELLAAAWLHDVIEDTPVGRERVDEAFGPKIAELVRACSGEGETRAERNGAIYRKIAACPRAATVKVADRIANVEAAPDGSSHMRRYRAEQAGFEAAVRAHVPADLWDRLERALGPPA